MKKIFLLLFIFPLFFACSSDDDKDDRVFIDNSLIAGKWYWIQATDSIVYVFDNDNNFAKNMIYDKYTTRLKQTIDFGSYRLTEDRLILGNGIEGKYYKLVSDSLFIQESKDDLIKYIRVKSANI